MMDGLDYGSVSRWVVLHFSRLKKRRKNVKTFSYEVKTEGGMFGSMAPRLCNMQAGHQAPNKEEWCPVY